MAFPVFSPGDVLNASDMNAVGLWKIGGATFSAVSGFNLPNGSFSATYVNYRLLVVINTVAADADFTGRMRASGTDDTGSNYQTGLLGISSNAGTESHSTGSAQTSFNFGEADQATANPYIFYCDIYQPFTTNPTFLLGGYTFINKAGNSRIFRVGGWYHTAATSNDSLAFISTQNITGEYWLYGYRNN